MANERIKLTGRRAEILEKLREFETRGANHIITIRDLVDPYEEFTELEVDRAEQAMISLKVLVEEAKKLKEQLEKINKALGV